MVQSNIRVIFGMKLKQLRADRDLSLDKFSEMLGLSASYINEIEKGKKYPKVEKIVQIANALNVPYDDLVSQKLDSDHRYLETLLDSKSLLRFPFHLFGITVQDVMGLLPHAPKEGRAFVKALVDTARSYDMRVENFFHTALRCYQEMNQNYFEEIEEAVDSFRKAKDWRDDEPISHEMLYNILREDFGYTIDEDQLSSTKALNNIRSIWIDGKPPRLLVNNKFTPIQKAFLAGREIGYLTLGLEQRGHCSPDIEVESFEQVLSAFKASYFSSALFMNRKRLQSDLKEFFAKQSWDEEAFLEMVDKYEVTSEMFFYRLSEVLPKFFRIERLHFLRLNKLPDSEHFALTKQLNMSQVNIPTGIDLNEHFCRRWLSVEKIEELEHSDKARTVGIQRSKFIGSEREYLCICIARRSVLNPGELISITTGFRIDQNLKRAIKFWNDPKIPTVEIGETCERCPLTKEECAERAAEAFAFCERRAPRCTTLGATRINYKVCRQLTLLR